MWGLPEAAATVSTWATASGKAFRSPVGTGTSFAARNDTLGGTLYLVGKNAADNSYVENAAPCSMCKRMIINAGIVRVIIRNTKDSFTSVNVDDWIYNDESLTGTRGY